MNLNQISYAVWLAGNGIEINSRICLVRKKWNWNSCKMTQLPFFPVLLNFTLFSNLFVKIHYDNYKISKISAVVTVSVVAATMVGGGDGACDGGGDIDCGGGSGYDGGSVSWW